MRIPILIGAPNTLPETMQNDPQSTVIAEGATDGLREIQRTLKGAGIESEIVRPPPQHCTS